MVSKKLKLEKHQKLHQPNSCHDVSEKPEAKCRCDFLLEVQGTFCYWLKIPRNLELVPVTQC